MYQPEGRSHFPILRLATLAICFATLAFAATVEAAPSLPSAAPTGKTSLQSVDDLEARLLNELNSLRRRAGLRPVRRSAELAAAAEHHSRAMARNGFFSHKSADGSSFAVRVSRFYRRPRQYDVYVVGENLQHHNYAKTPEQILDDWLDSPGHRQNLLGTWREVGFGVVRAIDAPGVFRGSNVTIVTADFGIRR